MYIPEYYLFQFFKKFEINEYLKLYYTSIITRHYRHY